MNDDCDNEAKSLLKAGLGSTCRLPNSGGDVDDGMNADAASVCSSVRADAVIESGAVVVAAVADVVGVGAAIVAAAVAATATDEAAVEESTVDLVEGGRPRRLAARVC